MKRSIATVSISGEFPEKLAAISAAGFDGIELNYDLESDLSPKATTADYHKIRKMAYDPLR